MRNGESQPPVRRPRPTRATAKFFEVSHLRGLRGAEQVAAICYRVERGSIEFLLVRTGGGRWIFPKGSAEPGLSTAQAAALEAFEEAGVHGRMEETSFMRYIRPKGSASSIELLVTAHLCEVLWLDSPQEYDRNPTWFNAEKAKRKLQEDRASDYGAELARVVDCAVARIKHLRNRGASNAISRRPFVVLDSPAKEDNPVRRRAKELSD